LAVVEEGGRCRARAGAPVVDLPRGWEHLLGGDAELTRLYLVDLEVRRRNGDRGAVMKE
jgi:hypothetical protein